MIKSLDLGLTAIPTSRPSTVRPFVFQPEIPTAKTTLHRINITLAKRTLPEYCPSNVQKICSNTQSKTPYSY